MLECHKSPNHGFRPVVSKDSFSAEEDVRGMNPTLQMQAKSVLLKKNPGESGSTRFGVAIAVHSYCKYGGLMEGWQTDSKFPFPTFGQLFAHRDTGRAWSEKWHRS